MDWVLTFKCECLFCFGSGLTTPGVLGEVSCEMLCTLTLLTLELPLSETIGILPPGVVLAGDVSPAFVEV